MIANPSKITVIHDDSYRAVQALEVARWLELKWNPPPAPPSGRGVSLNSPEGGAGGGSKIIITCGSDVIGKAIAAKQPGDILVSILDPRKNYDDFDLIFVPEHDPHPKRENVKTTKGLINHITPELLSGEKANFGIRSPVIALLIGGRHVGGNFSADDAAKLANIVNMFECSPLVTTSKRTEEKSTKVLKNELWKPQVFFDYNKDGLAANPYLKILSAAEKIIVTADSVRMLSEAASSGKQVFIFTPEKLHFSYAAMRDSFIRSGAAKDVGELQTSKPTILLKEAARVANAIINHCHAVE